MYHVGSEVSLGYIIHIGQYAYDSDFDNNEFMKLYPSYPV